MLTMQAALLGLSEFWAARGCAVVQPYKLNYECLGNQVHHLHWHVFPRQLDEPQFAKPVWTCMPPLEEAEQYKLDPQRHGSMLEAIRAELKRLTT